MLCIVQANARQILGEEDVEYPDMYREEKCQHTCGRFGCTGYGVIDALGNPLPPVRTRWNHSRGRNQWCIDGFKIDPAKMMEEESGIWERGVEQPVQEVPVAHASPGSVPSIAAFIAVHEKYGTRIFYPKLSTGGGQKHSYEYYTWWTTTITAVEEARLRGRYYYCNDQALDNGAKEQGTDKPTLLQQMRDSKFDPSFFLVRFTKLLSGFWQQRGHASCHLACSCAGALACLSPQFLHIWASCTSTMPASSGLPP